MRVNKNIFHFLFVIMTAHTLSYFVAGGLASEFYTKPVWNNPDPLLSLFFRSPQEPDLWHEAMTWQIPGQVLRSLLLGLALLPFAETLSNWSFQKRFIAFFLLLFVMAHIAGPVPSPGNIEGILFVKPRFVKATFWWMQLEMVLYSAMFGFIASRFGFKEFK